MENPNNSDLLTELLNKIDFLKGILSIWGEVGVGKTTLALQIAKQLSQLNQKVIYIYTKDTFPSEKYKNLTHNMEGSEIQNIKFVKFEDFEDLFTYFLNLEFVILDLKKLGLIQIGAIIIDSALDLYSLKTDMTKKQKNIELNYKLNQLLGTCTYLSNAYKIKIVLTNYPSVVQESENEEFVIKQKGGKVVEYWTSTSIQIHRTQNMSERRIKLITHHDNEIFEHNVKLDSRGFKLLI